MAFATAMAAFVPSGLRIPVFLGTLLGAPTLLFFLLRIPLIARWATQAIPTLVIVAIVGTLPVFFYFFLNDSWKGVVSGAMVAAVILTIVRLTKERKQLRPAEIRPGSQGLHWGGFGSDQVGMGPRSVDADGSPDAILVVQLHAHAGRLRSVKLRRIGRVGVELGQVWTTEPDPRIWPIGVVSESFQRLNPVRTNSLDIEVARPTMLFLHVSDVNFAPSGWFHPGQEYEASLAFDDAGTPLVLRCKIP